MESEPPIDWEQLKFQFTPTDYMFVAETDTHNTWNKGKVCPFRELTISPAATALNYGQAVFEGMKALRSIKGSIVLFRPIENARRFRKSAANLEMPPYPGDEFVQAVKDTVRANARWVPPHDKGSLYIRPVMIGSGPVLGVGPAPTYLFYIFVCPVGQYMSGGKLIVLDSVHRTAQYGTGDIKAAGNYAGTLRPHKIATLKPGYMDVLYLDSRQDRFIEELGSSNFFAVLKDGTLATPPLGAILPGITRDSVITIAREIFGWRAIERDLDIEEVLAQSQEAFCTGTAAVIQPITAICYKGTEYPIGTGEIGEHTEKLRQCLTEIQTQQCSDPFGWVQKVEM